MKNILFGILFFTLAHIIVWFQTNSQFVWEWPRKNPHWVVLATAVPSAYLLIFATRYMAHYYDGQIWPVRVVGFSIGMLIFGVMTKLFLDEGLNLKTIVSVVLAIILITIQFFWK